MFSKETEVLGLPQWQPKDHPDFLTDINGAFKKLDETAGDVNEQGGQLETINDQLTSLTTSVDDIRVQVDKLDVVPEKIEELDGRISTVEENLSNVTASVQKLSGDISNIDSRIELAESDINTIQEDLSTANDNIVSIAADNVKQANSITALKTSQAEQDNKIANLELSANRYKNIYLGNITIDNKSRNVNILLYESDSTHGIFVLLIPGENSSIDSRTNLTISLPISDEFSNFIGNKTLFIRSSREYIHYNQSYPTFLSYNLVTESSSAKDYRINISAYGEAYTSLVFTDLVMFGYYTLQP